MMNYLRLFYDSENVALTDYGVFLFVELDLSAGIFAGYDSVADLDVHLNFLAVNESAGTHCNDLSDLGLLLCGSGEDMPLLVVSSTSTGLTTTLSASGLMFISIPPEL